MSRTYNSIDSDGHVLEPPDFWDTYMDPAFRARAPRLFVDTDGKERLRVEDKVLGGPTGLGVAGAIGARQGAAAARMRTSPEYLEGAFRDRDNFLDTSALIQLVTRENVVVAGPTFAKDTPVVKGLFLVKRKAGMSVAEFQEYWRTRHAPLVPRTPHLIRYVQCHVLPELYETDTPPAYDGVAELVWPDLAKFQESWASPELQVEQANDTRNFVSGRGSTALLVEEARVLWP